MSQLLIAESPLIILPSLAKLLGVNEAIFLQQVHYWLGKSTTVHQGAKWTYNTVQQWAEQLQIFSVATVERVVAKLKKSGVLLVEKLNSNKSDRTNFYSINYRKLADLLGKEDSIKLMDSPPQNEVMEHRKKMASKPSNCGNVHTENSLDFSKNKKSVFEKDQPPAVQGSNRPVHPEASPEQLAALPDKVRTFYRQLRQLRLDVTADDPRLSQWLNSNLDQKIKRMAAAVPLTFNTMQFQWHTVDQVIIPQLEQKWSKVS
jgi:hypothetical protein